jgi:peptide/nickel transport system substrate-binding protein
MTQRFDRRTLLSGGVLATAGAIGATSLADSIVAEVGAVATNGPGRNGVTKAKARKGGHVTIGVSAEEQGFNPSTGRFDGTGFIYGRTVFDPLMAITATGKVVPYLAESLTSNKDFTKWTITVRPNITFHDGTSCDGAALLANIDHQYKSPLTGIAIQPLVESYEQSGPRSITLTMKRPWVTFPYTLASQQICFTAAPSMLSAPNGGSDHPIGTGPFVFESWRPNDHFTATANPDYWRPGLPHLDAITFRPIPDENARIQALQSGTIDLMHAFNARTLLEFRGNRQYSYVDDSGRMVGSPNCNSLMLNCAAAPFDDPEVRRIVATGVSSALFTKAIDLGISSPIDGIFQPGSPNYAKNNPYPAFNEAKAASMVKAYNAKHRTKLTFSLNTVAAPGTLRAAQLIQQMMRKIGITMDIKTMQQNELINDALYGSFQATQWSQFGTISPELNYIWFSTTTCHKTGISINMARNSDPRIEAAMNTAMSTPKSSVRVASWKRVNDLLGRDIPYVWTDRLTAGIISKPNVQNWAGPTSPAGVPLLGNAQGVFWPTQIWKS